MFPVAATGLSRCTDEDTVLGGYLIPAGTEVQVSMYAGCVERLSCMCAASLPQAILTGLGRCQVSQPQKYSPRMPGDRDAPVS